MASPLASLKSSFLSISYRILKILPNYISCLKNELPLLKWWKMIYHMYINFITIFPDFRKNRMLDLVNPKSGNYIWMKGNISWKLKANWKKCLKSLIFPDFWIPDIQFFCLRPFPDQYGGVRLQTNKQTFYYFVVFKFLHQVYSRYCPSICLRKIRSWLHACLNSK